MQTWHRRTRFCRTLTNIPGMFLIISQTATILVTNSMGSKTQVNLDIPIEMMKGIQVRWPRRPWNRDSLPIQRPGNTALRWLRIFTPKWGGASSCCIHILSRTAKSTPHFSVNVRKYLNAVFPGRWIGRRGPIPWPARSPDLNRLHYFLWEYLKSLVFETPVETDMDLVAWIVSACDIIQNTQGIFVRVLQNLVCQCHACIEDGGRQFESLL